MKKYAEIDVKGSAVRVLRAGEIVVYQPDSTLRLEVRVDGSTAWLNRQQMAELFGRDVVNQVVAKFATTAADGKCWQGDHNNLATR